MTSWRWRNFTRNELACKGTGTFVMNEVALDKLQAMRDIVGKPFNITSAYRSPEHNKKVGGAPQSMHLQGRAFDISTQNHDKQELYDAAVQAGFTGFGFYKTFLHVDDGKPRSWGSQKARRLYIPDDESRKITKEPAVIVGGAATGGAIAGGAVIEMASKASPAISAFSALDWRVGLAVVAVLAIGGAIWWWRRKR